MDALRQRSLLHRPDERGARHALGGASPRAALSRGWVAAGLATVGLTTAMWLSAVKMPSPIAVTDTARGPMVSSVAIGSRAWVNGVRAGAPAQRLPDGNGFHVSANGAVFGVVELPGNFTASVVLGSAVALGAALLGTARLPGAAIALGAGVAIALGPALPRLGLPAAIPLALLSGATTVAAMRIPVRRLQRRYDVLGAVALLGTASLAGLLMSGIAASERWDLVWLAPLAIVIGLGSVGELLAIRARLGHLPDDGRGRVPRLIAAAVPLAASSRLDGAEDERSRLAVELHNRVLPRLSTSARAIRAGERLDHEADRLDEIAVEVRAVMKRHETVSLEVAGVAAAIRAELESLDTAGIHVELDLRERGRPPARVELAAYRIAQAAIDNAIRHSGGDRLEVSLSSAAEWLELVVRDDGVGIDDLAETSARRRGRIGLAQMRVRAESVGATLDIDRLPDGGTAVRFLWAR